MDGETTAVTKVNINMDDDRNTVQCPTCLGSGEVKLPGSVTGVIDECSECGGFGYVEAPRPKYKRPTPQPAPTSVRTGEDLEPYIQAGMERTGKSRHAYLLSAVRYVALKEVLPEKSEEIPESGLTE